MKNAHASVPGFSGALAALLVLLGTVSGSAVAAAPAESGPRLYIMDCGTIPPMDAALFGLKAEELSGDGSFVTPCYLVVHPKGTLIWDVGQIPDADIPVDGQRVAQSVFVATRQLAAQLAEIGYQPADITYLAMSHYHADHTANANMFAGSTWIVQQPEYDMMFSEAEIGIRTPASYNRLKDSKRIMLQGEDHDVFGDGSVIIKFAPGHTPGHQMLFLRLRKHGPLLLAGDLYHYPEEKTLDRVPTFDADAAMTRATRVKTDQFLREEGAEMWIQHDVPTNAGLNKSPAYYD